jgi:hypothetical protein
MAIRDISSEMMVKLSAAWLDPARQRPLLESVPLVAAVLPKIDEAHRGLLDTQPRRAPAPLEAELDAIQQKQVAVDTVHDRKMRGTFGLLTALADLTEDPSEAARYVELRDTVCPKGLKGTTQSYAEQAGAARLLPARLDAEDEKLLESIPLRGGRLKDAVKAWTGAALELEKLEDEKAEIARQLEASEAIRPADALQARYRWIRAARGLEANLELAEGDEATLQAILGPLYEAAKKAERKKVAKGGAPGEEPTGGGGGTEGGEK